MTIVAACASAASPDNTTNETLYNGIQLPKQWPPTNNIALREPMIIPYLLAPPGVIPIDIGRQLFVDDFLIENTTLKRTFHLAEYYPHNPVLKPDKPWEMTDTNNPTAMIFSDGVWFDPRDNLFKMWYMGGFIKSTCYAISKDGITWEKPVLDVIPASNIVHDKERDSATVWLDLAEKDPARRFKLFVMRCIESSWLCFLHMSSDGIHWGEPVAKSRTMDDRTTVFYNPFRKVWVYSIRAWTSKPRMRWRRYREHADPVAGATWKDRNTEAPLWIGADTNDPPRTDYQITPQLYNLDAVGYESLMLGFFSIWPGDKGDRPKPCYVCLGFSRDGFHWYRPDHRPFMGVSENYGDWNWGNVQSAGGGCLIVGNKLYFYVSGRAGRKDGKKVDGVCSTGLATLRRDGFASMDAAEGGGMLTTRPVRFSGKYLFVNVAAKEGELRAEVLDTNGKVITPFSKENCVPVHADATLHGVTWKGAPDLSALANKSVRLRFHLKKGELYAFWVSDDQSGASHGYVAAGGPGFTGMTDTVGRQGYRATSNEEQRRNNKSYFFCRLKRRLF
jgi:hypothetical protein